MSDAPKIYALLALAMGKVGVVGKEGRNQQQNYAFRAMDDVAAAVQPVFAELGIVPVPFVVEREREEFKTAKGTSMVSVRLLVDHHFYAPDGSFVTVRTLGEGMDSGDKATNKALSAALKYALTELLVIPTYERGRDSEDDSPDINDRARQQPAPQHGFSNDFEAMKWADEFCLLLPCGRSAHLEAGWAIGQGKRTSIYIPELVEPELMYLTGGERTKICATYAELVSFHEEG